MVDVTANITEVAIPIDAFDLDFTINAELTTIGNMDITPHFYKRNSTNQKNERLYDVSLQSFGAELMDNNRILKVSCVEIPENITVSNPKIVPLIFTFGLTLGSSILTVLARDNHNSDFHYDVFLNLVADGSNTADLYVFRLLEPPGKFTPVFPSVPLNPIATHTVLRSIGGVTYYDFFVLIPTPP